MEIGLDMLEGSIWRKNTRVVSVEKERLVMAKFSVGGEDDGEGPSSRWPKRPRASFEERIEDGNPLTRRKNLNEMEQEDEEEEEEEVKEEEEVEDEEGSDGVDASLGSNRDGSISVILTDPEVLDCSICFDSLTIPVYQCEYGHIACSSCSIKLGNKCPSCSWPIGYNRCRAIEKVLESVKISCQNTKYGCKETVLYSRRHNHEETCMHAPCSCPLPDCNFCGSPKLLSRHFRRKHSNSVMPFLYNHRFSVALQMNGKFVVLQEEDDGALFILNNSVELLGNAVTVSCIGQKSSMQRFSYDVVARNGLRSVKLKSVTENSSGQVNNPPSTGFLLVPSGFFGSGGNLTLDLCIYKN